MTKKSYPARNRMARTLDLLHLEIEDADGVHVFDPNGLKVAALDDGLPSGGPVAASLLSGLPGHLYRDADLEIALTRDEIVALVVGRLTPDQYFRLREHFGMFFLIHDDFYDEASGVSFVSGLEAWEDEGPQNQVRGV